MPTHGTNAQTLPQTEGNKIYIIPPHSINSLTPLKIDQHVTKELTTDTPVADTGAHFELHHSTKCLDPQDTNPSK